jgi:hypothetical protein
MHTATNRAVISGGMTDMERNKLEGFNTSEESILPMHSNAAVGGSGITKMTQIHVTSEGVGGARSVEDRF